MRENIPHGVHPRVTAKGHMGTKSNYYVPTPPIPEDFIHPYDLENFATRLIASISDEMAPQAKRDYWEKRILRAWFHLYGDGWSYWRLIIPWVPMAQIKDKAITLGCEQPWNWMAKCRFLESHGFMWSLEDLNYLIDRYPDRQRNDREQGIFVSDRSFTEIQSVAKSLNLPCAEVLGTLADYARKLNVG